MSNIIMLVGIHRVHASTTASICVQTRFGHPTAQPHFFYRRYSQLSPAVQSNDAVSVTANEHWIFGMFLQGPHIA